MAKIVWCINIFHLIWPTSLPYLVKHRYSQLLQRWYVLFATNYLTTELAHSKPKYGLFSRVISCHDRLPQKCENSCSKCAPRTRTQALRPMTRFSRLTLAPGKRWCHVLDVPGRHPVETKNHLSATCACMAVTSKEEKCRDSMPS